MRGWLFAGAALVFACGAAFAAESCNPKNLTKSGTFTADTKSVGFLVSVHWGDGVVTLNNGEKHNFHIIGGKLIETGFGETHIKGEIYNVEKAEDINGVYTAPPRKAPWWKDRKGGLSPRTAPTAFMSTANLQPKACACRRRHLVVSKSG